ARTHPATGRLPGDRSRSGGSPARSRTPIGPARPPQLTGRQTRAAASPIWHRWPTRALSVHFHGKQERAGGGRRYGDSDLKLHPAATTPVPRPALPPTPSLSAPGTRASNRGGGFGKGAKPRRRAFARRPGLEPPGGVVEWDTPEATGAHRGINLAVEPVPVLQHRAIETPGVSKGGPRKCRRPRSRGMLEALFG